MQIIVYTAWHIWKERCRRAFDKKAVSPTDLVHLIQADILAERSVLTPMHE